MVLPGALAVAHAHSSTDVSFSYPESEEKVLDMILHDYDGHKIFILAPLVRSRKGHYRELFESMRRKGYLNIRVDGEMK